MNAQLDSFYFLDSNEICKALSKRVKVLRKKTFKRQEVFAEHIGMKHGTYARFEKTGQVSLINLIDIIKGLGLIGEIEKLFTQENDDITWDEE